MTQQAELAAQVLQKIALIKAREILPVELAVAFDNLSEALLTTSVLMDAWEESQS